MRQLKRATNRLPPWKRRWGTSPERRLKIIALLVLAVAGGFGTLKVARLGDSAPDEEHEERG